MDRRKLLTGIGVALAGGVGGYLDEGSIVGGGEFDPDVEQTLRRGTGEPVSIEARPDREYEYIDGESAVRVTYERDDRPDETRTMSFDRWAANRAKWAGVSHLRSSLRTNGLLAEGINVGLTHADALGGLDIDDSEFERSHPLVPAVFHHWLYSRDGTLLARPEVDFETVVASTPRWIRVTMLFEEREYVEAFPVACRRGYKREE